MKCAGRVEAVGEVAQGVLATLVSLGDRRKALGRVHKNGADGK
jgi:hypothetical protein